MLKKLLYSLAAVSSLTFATSCSDWLDVQPNNEQITDEFWQSKEDVESVVMSGYYYMRNCVPTMIKWGELRGGSLYSTVSSESKLQDFNMTPSHALTSYSTIFQVINAANSVLNYAPGVIAIDETYHESMMKSHLCEAYFMRAYCNLILLKNYKEFPLILSPYVDDTASFDIAKSPEDVIVAQIKADVIAALATGAAKGAYEVEWETKGRVTKWALYALMADVCLWDEDYDTCKEYCDLILNATDTFRPAFITNTSLWYSIFYEGNTNESIFELNWDNATGETASWTGLMAKTRSDAKLLPTNRVIPLIREDITECLHGGQPTDRVGRMLMASVNPNNDNSSYLTNDNYLIWKYNGTEVTDYASPRQVMDNNFIIYRVADVIFYKAFAEAMLGNKVEAIKLLNRIRVRGGLDNYSQIDDNDTAGMEAVGELDLMQELLNQHDMEFLGEAKRWYMLLWFGRVANYKYKDEFVDLVVEGNQTTNKAWVRSVLNDPNAWYIPLPQSDIEHNTLLVQNPYYSSIK